MRFPPFILASASPRRSELLRELGADFRVVTAPTPETHAEYYSPHEIAQLNAYRKARAVAKKHPDDLVLGADTIVCLGARVYGKPRDLADARRMLRELQGRAHEVVTGVCLVRLRNHRQRLLAVSTRVRFRPLDAGQIDRYLGAIEPLDKAGAYAIQDHGEWIVESVGGSFSNVVGLPLESVEAELADWRD
jgi:septum formation protein